MAKSRARMTRTRARKSLKKSPRGDHRHTIRMIPALKRKRSKGMCLSRRSRVLKRIAAAARRRRMKTRISMLATRRACSNGLRSRKAKLC